MNRPPKEAQEADKTFLRHNFAIQLLATALTKCGDVLMDVKTVLPWLMSALGAPLWMVGLLVPIRESGALLPQLWFAQWVKRFQQRKWVWVIAACVQSASVLGIGLSVFYLKGAESTLGMILFLALFSVVRGLCSISSKDVLGRTIPKLSRGRLTGWSTSVAGAVSLLLGYFLIERAGQSVTFYGFLLVVASATWLIAALVYAMIKEPVPETEKSKHGAGTLKILSHLREDSSLRNFVITRALLLASSLSIPFYTMWIQSSYPENQSLGSLVILGSVASIVNGPLWGRFADRSSRKVLMIGAGLAGACGLALSLGSYWFGAMPLPYLLGAFFLVVLAHQGIRVGRKTYVVDMASNDRRTEYVAVSNTLIGLILLSSSFAGAFAQWFSVEQVIGLLAVVCLVGGVFAALLPEVQKKRG